MLRTMTMALVIAGGWMSAEAAVAADADQRAVDEAAIRKAVESYVAAFNQGDAKKLAALWSPEAVYTNPLSGEQVVGRDEIEKQFSALFANAKGAQLEAKTESIRFVSPNVAVEQGTASVKSADGAPDKSAYTAVYVKRDAQWLLDRVTEEKAPVVVSNYEHLKDLEWMVGTWVDEDEQNRIETTCKWAKNQNFLVRSFVMSVRDRIEMAGMQIVGWDPAQKRIRSWVFDSDGGFGEGLWTKKGNRYYIHATGTLPSGGKTSAVNIMTRVNDDSFTWQSIQREADGELLPNVDEVVVVRQPTAE